MVNVVDFSCSFEVLVVVYFIDFRLCFIVLRLVERFSVFEDDGIS